MRQFKFQLSKKIRCVNYHFLDAQVSYGLKDNLATKVTYQEMILNYYHFVLFCSSLLAHLILCIFSVKLHFWLLNYLDKLFRSYRFGPLIKIRFILVP